MSVIRFEIDLEGGKPPTKGRHRTCQLPGGGFRQYPDPDTARWERVIRIHFHRVAPARVIHDGPVLLNVVAFWPIPRSWPKWKQALAAEEKMPHVGRGDADNVLKLVMDALEGVAYRNDHQVSDVFAAKRYSPKPRLEVALEFVEEAGR